MHSDLSDCESNHSRIHTHSNSRIYILILLATFTYCKIIIGKHHLNKRQKVILHILFYDRIHEQLVFLKYYDNMKYPENRI